MEFYHFMYNLEAFRIYLYFIRDKVKDSKVRTEYKGSEARAISLELRCNGVNLVPYIEIN